MKTNSTTLVCDHCKQEVTFKAGDRPPGWYSVVKFVEPDLSDLSARRDWHACSCGCLEYLGWKLNLVDDPYDLHKPIDGIMYGEGNKELNKLFKSNA